MSLDLGKWCSHQGKQGTLRLRREFSTVVVVSGGMVTLAEDRPTYWNKSPATNDGSKQLATADVDVPGTERHEVVGCADGVG